jgi:two-component system phosphate regulon response regulator OmpR
MFTSFEILLHQRYMETMHVKSVLVVDDDERLLHLITLTLMTGGFRAVGTKSVSEANELIAVNRFDILVIDWMMPNVSGIEFVRSLRESQFRFSMMPTLMLTAMSDINSKITGFEAGVDDYLTKPFEERELIARINAIIARSQSQYHTGILKLGACEFNMLSGELRYGESNVCLSTMELTLLRTLCQKLNHPCTRGELAQKFVFRVSERTVDVQIARLRQKIGDDAKDPRVIKTVRHVGYIICA